VTSIHTYTQRDEPTSAALPAIIERPYGGHGRAIVPDIALMTGQRYAVRIAAGVSVAVTRRLVPEADDTEQGRPGCG
jgi:hypothetical protein